MKTPFLIAIDMGIRTGIAIFSKDGALLVIRSGNFGSKTGLKSAVFRLLKAFPSLEYLAIEGGGPLSDIWIKEAQKRKLETIRFQAETWRKSLLYSREQRSGSQAKRIAILRAMEIIRQSEIPTPKTITNDLAEAILAGKFALDLLSE